MTRWLLLPLPLLLLACPPVRGDDDDDAAGDDDDDVGTGCPAVFAEVLPALSTWSTMSCSSVHFAATPDDTQTRALTLDWSLGEDPQPDALYRTEFGVDPASLRIETGENLLHYDCNDALWLEEIVTREMVATSGSAELQVTQGGGWDAQGTLSLQGVVVLDADTGQTCTLPEVEWIGLPIGWLPG